MEPNREGKEIGASPLSAADLGRLCCRAAAAGRPAVWEEDELSSQMNGTIDPAPSETTLECRRVRLRVGKRESD